VGFSKSTDRSGLPNLVSGGSTAFTGDISSDSRRETVSLLEVGISITSTT